MLLFHLYVTHNEVTSNVSFQWNTRSLGNAEPIQTKKITMRYKKSPMRFKDMMLLQNWELKRLNPFFLFFFSLDEKLKTKKNVLDFMTFASFPWKNPETFFMFLQLVIWGLITNSSFQWWWVTFRCFIFYFTFYISAHLALYFFIWTLPLNKLPLAIIDEEEARLISLI